MNSSNLKSFDIGVLPITRGTDKRIIFFRKKQTIFSQGQRSDAIFYIEKGSVKLTVNSKHGKEAVVGIFHAGHLFGESCLAEAEPPVRFHNAIALSDMRAVKIDGDAMKRTLLASGTVSYAFITYLLGRYAQIQEDLVNNLLSSSEERLARALVYLAQYGKETKGESAPRLSQQTLADMIGTTRQHVNHLMVRFRKLGLVEDTSGSESHKPLRDRAANE
jgi:CRP/FNR family transcriptional regulator, cyclic AMP receptor protein